MARFTDVNFLPIYALANDLGMPLQSPTGDSVGNADRDARSKVMVV